MSISSLSPSAKAAAIVQQIPPLENGDRLTRPEFERRYAAMPHLKKAELIAGVVYMPSPVRHKGHGLEHSAPYSSMIVRVPFKLFPFFKFYTSDWQRSHTNPVAISNGKMSLPISMPSSRILWP